MEFAYLFVLSRESYEVCLFVCFLSREKHTTFSYLHFMSTNYLKFAYLYVLRGI